MTVYTSGSWHVKPGHEDEFVQAWGDFAKESAHEVDPGLRPILLHDRDDASHFISIGPWQSGEQVQQWRDSELFKRHMQRLRQLTDEIRVSTFDIALELEPASVR